jgi:hypothetical protein
MVSGEVGASGACAGENGRSQVKAFTSGAKSSEIKPRYDLLYPGITRGAIRMAEGAQSHGERNFEKGANDPVFVKDRENHLVEHALAYAAGDRSTDHLGAVIANACILIRLAELSSPNAGTILPTEQHVGGEPV